MPGEAEFRAAILRAMMLVGLTAAWLQAQPPGRDEDDAPQTVPGFGHIEGQPRVPGFGKDAEVLAYIEKQDLDRAADRMRRYDRNRDGYIDRREARDGRWTDDPFRYDRDRDNRLSRMEMAERYARRRIAESGQPDPFPSSSGAGSQSRSSSEDERRRREEEERRRREEEARRRGRYGDNRTPGDRAAWYLTGSLIQRYDRNRDGKLNSSEWRRMGLSSSPGDTDHDGDVERDELARWLSRRTNKSAPPIPEGLPEWFLSRDLDGDGQIMMSEFAEDWDEDKVAEFTKHDLNNDGIIVAEECLRGESLPAGTYANHEFQIIPARGTIYSQIEVEDDEPITDLNVQLSITHTHDDYLDAFLIDPYGQYIELFTGVGGSDDHFNNTILDDEAREPIVRGRPPFAGRYIPEAAIKRQPSLKQFYGQGIEGSWTLMIRAERSDRPGALHGWALIAESASKEEPSRDRDDGPPDYRSGYRDGGRSGRPERSEGGPRGSYRPSWRGGPPRD